MKQLLLAALILGGCAALQKPQNKPVVVSTPVVVEETQTEVSQPVEVVNPTQPVVTPIEVSVPETKVTRYFLKYPKAYAQHVLRAEKFYQLALTDSTVLNKSKFDYSTATPEDIRASIRKGPTATVTTYKPSIWKKGKWSNVIGYHSNGTIFHNVYYVGRLSDCGVVNHLVHEYSHRLGYSHGTNSPDGKDNSIPYWLGDRAEELCKLGVI